MDAEKSSNSSFEDLSNINESEMKTSTITDREGNERSTSKDEEKDNNVQISTTDALNNERTKTATHLLLDSEGGERIKSGQDSTAPRDRTSNTILQSFLDNEANKVTETAPITTTTTPESPTVSLSQSQTSIGESLTKESNTDDAESETADSETSCDVLGNGQLVKTIITKSASTERPKRGDLVTINFTGKLKNGTIVEKETNFQLHVGDFEVVQGLDMVIPLMNLHEVSQVDVDARFAYGTLGLKNENNPDASVPPGEALTYTIELLNIKDEDFADLKSFEVRRKYGTGKKERANFWYNRSEFNIAIQLYRRALEYLDDRDGDPDAAFEKEDIELSNSDLQALLEDRLIVYNNMAMAQIKIAAFDAALKSVENVLRCQPNNSKALYRKGRILEGMGDVKGAISLLQKAATLEPDTKIIQQDLAKLIIKARREEHNEKELYQKMLGQAKKLEMKNKQPHKQQTTPNSKAKLLGYLMGSILIGVAGVAIYRYKY